MFEIIESYCGVFVLFVYRPQLNIENKITIKMKQVFFSHPKKLLFMKEIWKNKNYMQIQACVLVAVYYCVERISSYLVIAS